MIRRNIELKLNLKENLEDDQKDAYDDNEIISEETLVDDYELVKRNIRKSLNMNQKVIDILFDEFEAIPSVDKAETLAKLLESMGNSSEKLLKASKMMADIAKTIKSINPDEKEQPVIFKDAIFVGGLNELFKLKKEREQKALEAANKKPLEENKEDEDKDDDVPVSQEFASSAIQEMSKVIDEKILNAEIINDGE
jgi:hypothetical protein